MKFIKILYLLLLPIIYGYNYNKYYSIINNNIPKNYISFKRTKLNYFNNNLYFDIYQNTFWNNNIYNKYNSLTAEHIFPQSFLNKDDKSRFDMHNIFLTESSNNNYRSNYKFISEKNLLLLNNNEIYINLIDKKKIYNSNNNYRINKLKYFIPLKKSRGIIARSICYMFYTYDNLTINNVIDNNTLIEWNIKYPPSEIEFKLNDLIYNIQGNYNYFINDYNLVNIFISNY